MTFYSCFALCFSGWCRLAWKFSKRSQRPATHRDDEECEGGPMLQKWLISGSSSRVRADQPSQQIGKGRKEEIMDNWAAIAVCHCPLQPRLGSRGVKARGTYRRSEARAGRGDEPLDVCPCHFDPWRMRSIIRKFFWIVIKALFDSNFFA
jgi:hypothetical protein